MNSNLKELEKLNSVGRTNLVRECAIQLFEGNKTSAEEWLNSPKSMFNSSTPLKHANTIDGAKDVLMLIGRLEHGVFS